MNADQRSGFALTYSRRSRCYVESLGQPLPEREPLCKFGFSLPCSRVRSLTLRLRPRTRLPSHGEVPRTFQVTPTWTRPDPSWARSTPALREWRTPRSMACLSVDLFLVEAVLRPGI